MYLQDLLSSSSPLFLLSTFLFNFQLLSFSVSSLVCLSFCGTTKKPRSLEPGGGWDVSFIHSCTHYKFVVFLTVTAGMWFCFFFFLCCQLLDLIRISTRYKTLLPFVLWTQNGTQMLCNQLVSTIWEFQVVSLTNEIIIVRLVCVLIIGIFLKLIHSLLLWYHVSLGFHLAYYSP